MASHFRGDTCGVKWNQMILLKNPVFSKVSGA
jgi:hypothetical protein